MRLLAVAAAFVGCFLTAGYSPTLYSEGFFRASAQVGNEVSEYYLRLDFQKEISELEFSKLDKYGRKGFFKTKDIIAEDLSPVEKMYVGRHTISPGYYVGADVVCGALLDYAIEYNEVPSSGIELLNLYHSKLLTIDGMEEFKQLSETEQLAQVFRCVNPTSGKFYQSFTDSSWHQYGIYMDKLGYEESNTVDIGYEQRVSQDTRVYQAWRFVVFGEEPGKILIDKTVRTFVDGAKISLKSTCGCSL